ncbi:MAG: hypothetical protein H6718_19830 [Polyangiaceae bacterium]|nr:hypothetical protein [Polyangiaceae bacterium]MCB9605539.1 hypothetical protein [Polyangiaceae bacterium]
MLEGLDEVDWGALRHAYGSAVDVPAHLRMLAFGDEAGQQEAFGELFSSVCHQGTVYPASAAVFPFLYELLECSGASLRSWIALLIASMAEGETYLRVHASNEDGKETWRRILSGRGQSLDAELAREADEVAAVRAAASRGLESLAPFLSDPEPELRRVISSALMFYPEHAEWSRGALEAALERETDADVRETMRLTLAAIPV